MISVFQLEDINQRLAALIDFGMAKGYSYDAIEEIIVKSKFVHDLESNHFDEGSSIEQVVSEAYKSSIYGALDFSFRSLFLGETYARLFFDEGKSFEYLFLYWPLSSFDARYGIYHEMDYSAARIDMERNMKGTTLLRAILRKKGIKGTELSTLTGINYNTIDRYMRSDDHLYAASYRNICLLSRALNVKENIFCDFLDIYFDPSYYLLDPSKNETLSYLGLFLASYCDPRIKTEDYRYDPKQNLFVSKNDLMRIRVFIYREDKVNLDDIHDNDYLVAFPFARLESKDIIEALSKTPAREILLINATDSKLIRKGKSILISEAAYLAALRKSTHKHQDRG